MLSLTYEEHLQKLRETVHSSQKNLLSDYLNHKKRLPEIFEELTRLAESTLEDACSIALEETSKKLPPPLGSFVIVAMGKFGGKELTFYSDLDVVFLYENYDDTDYYNFFVRRLISALTLCTKDGYAYQIDAELRPSGNSGMLISTLDAFQNHYQTAQNWERQALLKARPLNIVSQPIPSAEFFSKTQEVVDRHRYQDPRVLPSAADLSKELYEIRLRIQNELSGEKKNVYNLKKGYGGLIDIEFLVQYLQLLHSRTHSELQTTSTLKALTELASLKLLTAKEAAQLEAIYLYYRELESYFRILLEKSTDEIRVPSEVTFQVEEKFYQGKNILDTYLPNRETVRSLYLKALGLTL